MKQLRRFGFCAAALLCMSTATAETWVEGTISEIRVVWSNNPTVDGIYVLGTFSPSLGCTKSGFMIFQSDTYFNQSYALLLAAKASGSRVKLLDWYCMPNGYARGNGYAMAP